MKTKLKILYKTPDLDALADKHQDFGGLMDSFMDEKIRRRKKLYRFSSFAIVIISTAFLSWLYWGYEPASSDSSLPSQEAAPAMVAEQEEKKMKPEEVEQEEEAVQNPEPVATEQIETKALVVEQPKKEEEPTETAPQEVIDESNEMAMPSVTITRTESVDATPVEGLENLYRYLYSKVEIPDSLLNERGGLFLEISFQVQLNGNITDIAFSKALPAEVAKGLRKIFVDMPVWEPAKVGEETVVSEVKLPITFQKKD